VIRWDEILQLDRHKQRFLHLIHFAHRIHTKDHENNIHIACPSNPVYTGHKLNSLLGAFRLRVPDGDTFRLDLRVRRSATTADGDHSPSISSGFRPRGKTPVSRCIR
jgi:hypothetical protein